MSVPLRWAGAKLADKRQGSDGSQAGDSAVLDVAARVELLAVECTW